MLTAYQWSHRRNELHFNLGDFAGISNETSACVDFHSRLIKRRQKSPRSWRQKSDPYVLAPHNVGRNALSNYALCT